MSAVRGELTQPGLGLGDRRDEVAERTHAVLHCAASISFDLPLPEARAINVDGTSRVLDFALDAQARGGLERFLHVSTAYVSGRHEGAFRERQLDTGQSFRNTYEQTKADAEQIVGDGAASSGPRSRGRASSWARATRAGRRRSTSSTGRCRRSRAGSSRSCPRCRPAAWTSCRSTTWPTRSSTCSTAARPACSTSSPGATRRRSTSSTTLASEYFGKPVPPFVDPVDPDSDDHDSVYVPYFDMRVVFDDARARSVLVPAGIEAPPLRDYFAKLMDYAKAARWGKKMTREAARARRAERGHVSSKTHEPGYSAKRNRGEFAGSAASLGSGGRSAPLRAGSR